MFSVMGRKNRIIAAVLLLSLIGSVAGCGASSAEKQIDTTKANAEEFETTASGEYAVPNQIPSVLADQIGYNTESVKTVILHGKKLPKTFSIKELGTKEEKYTGDVVKSVYNDDTKEYTGIGYFTDLKEAGNYYVSADIIGESYSFAISEDAHADVFNEACKKYYINRCGTSLSEDYAGENAHSACHTTPAHLQDHPETEIDVTGGWHMDEQADRDTTVGCKVAENLLLAFEMNEAAFTDEAGIPESGNEIPDILDEVRYEVEWLLKMQDAKTGGEYGAALTDSSGGGDVMTYPVIVTPVSMDATINFASVLAKFSYIYQKYDGEFATTCLKAADRAWSCYFNNQKAQDNTTVFKAAAELYRATGSLGYETVLEEYFAEPEFDRIFNEDENILIGSVVYLSTSQKVDVSRCEYLMKLLMVRSERIAQKATQSAYLVTKTDVKSFNELLEDMRCLTITDHIIYNHEYTTIIENHAHFLMGMNPGAVNYVTDTTERTYADEAGIGILNDPQADALLVFMLSVLVC